MLSDGASSKRIAALAETLNITAAGANGLDTGAEAASTWYHIWAIAKADGTKKTLASLSATAPTMPSGYTFLAYLGAIYNNGSSNFITMRQTDKSVSCSLNTALSNGNSTVWQSVSLVSIIPSTATNVSGQIKLMLPSDGARGCNISSTSSDVGSKYLVQNSVGGSTYGSTPFRCHVPTSQTIYYKVLVADTLATIEIAGWEY
ncbi:MAG: hypothetical protein Q8N12_05670 [Thermodesulfovibrionales bacterium]|nr:hypothetical protein [Thermodesulfovibrionales bacterium]